MKQAYFLFLLFAVFILSVVMMAFQNVSQLLGVSEPSLKVIIYIKESTPAEDREKLKMELKSSSLIAQIDEQSPQDQLNDLQDVFSKESSGWINLDDIQKTLPESYSLLFSTLENKTEFLKSFSTRPEIESIITGDSWRHQFQKIEKSILIFTRLALLFFFLLVAFITAVTTRLSLLEEQKNIEIFSLLGFPPVVIYKKYFFKFLLFALVALGSGLILSYGFFKLIQFRLHLHEPLSFVADRITFLNSGLTFALALGLFLSFFISGYLTTRLMIYRVYFRGDL